MGYFKWTWLPDIYDFEIIIHTMLLFISTVSRIKQRGQGRQALKDLKNMVENRKRELQKKQTNKTK